MNGILFSEPLAENSKQLLDRQQTDCVAFEVMIPPVISFASEVEAKECVTNLYFKSEANNCSVPETILQDGIPIWVVEQVVAGNNITIL